jgi:hypothetical protein
VGRDNYEQLMSGGLYENLIASDLLISHEETDVALAPRSGAWKVIRPKQVPFISYPYEWSFSQLKNAALLCLDVQIRALKHDMTLKDASAYNVQFMGNKPVFIDTLSFQGYSEGSPWGAYRQFCQHFLAPLALMSKTDVRLNRMLHLFVDGIPLDIASKMLPFWSKLNLGLAMHIVLHARSQKKHAGTTIDKAKVSRRFSKHSFLALIDSLKSCVEKLNWQPNGTEWHDYYESNNNYGDAGLAQKDSLIEQMIPGSNMCCVWDLGANTGRFSRIAAKYADLVVAWDVDPACVETNYQLCRENGEINILPLFLDLTNPSASIGWGNGERLSFIDRGPAELTLALGLVHHMAISNNVPLPKLAEFFAKTGEKLIIEFVPKQDSQVVKLLSTREDVFPDYHVDGFEEAFGQYFILEEKKEIPDSSRTLYRMTRR